MLIRPHPRPGHTISTPPGPVSASFDANGNIASTTDWNGNRTDFTYDLIRNLETQRVEGLTASDTPTPETRTVSTAWDANYRLAAQVAEPLRVTTSVYDPDGTACGARGALCSKTIQATTDSSGSLGFSATPSGAARAFTYTYNSHGALLTVDGPRTDVSDVTTYVYYADDDADAGKRGNVATITDAAGHVTNITAYNAHGQPLTIIDANGVTTMLAYDARLRLKSRNVAGELTSYDYDAVGQLTKVTLPDQSSLSYTYDSAHRLTAMSDNLGNSMVYMLDAMGNRTHEEVHDPVGALAQVRSRVYNNLNRLTQEIGAQNQTMQYGYDDQGNVTSVTDPLNHARSNQYDALNRLAQVTDQALGITKYGYNGLDALTQVTDPRNLVTGYTVDGLGNLTLKASPDTGNTVNTYDAAANLLTQADAKGQVTAYAYDALNRVSLVTFHDGSKQAYTYDQGTNAIGRLSSITETDSANSVTSVIAYVYDLHGRVTSDTRTLGGVAYVTAYAYDSSGRLTGMTYPGGRTVAYTLDALGRVAQIDTAKTSQTQTVVSGVTYQPFGGVKGFTFGNGHVYTRTYDQDGRISSYTLGDKIYAIGYDSASRVEFISDVAVPANSNNYGYDALDRLTSAVTPTTSYSYGYDAIGNRLSKTAGAGTDTYAYAADSNRIASITPASGPARSFVFDANGSTTADGKNTYAYDTRGRMVQATSAIGTTTYQVNAIGQRVRKTNNSTDTVFHYDTRGHLIAETDPVGTLKREIIYLGDMPVEVIQ
jgi:YD repeat-containing protein